MERAIKVLDHLPAFSTHKIGLIYVGNGQVRFEGGPSSLEPRLLVFSELKMKFWRIRGVPLATVNSSTASAVSFDCPIAKSRKSA